MIQSSISLAFADGEYLFRLGLAQIEELQRKCGIGIGGLCARLAKGRYQLDDRQIGAIAEAQFYFADIVETIRQGLIGGAQGLVDGEPVTVTDLLANQLVQTYVVSRPLASSWSLAFAIIGALMEGYDLPKKAEPPAAAAPRAPGRKRGASTTLEHSSTAP